MAAQSQVLRARLHLLTELRAGSRPPGAPISVKDAAAALKLSHTPIREALERLAGEGVVTVAGERNGFCVPSIGFSGYRQRIEIIRLLVSDVHETAASDPKFAPAFDAKRAEADPVAAVEAIFAWIIGNHDNAELARAVGRIGTVLAPYRRVEPAVLPDWLGELERVHDGVAAGKWKALMRSYWSARLSHAGAIVDAVERAHADIRQI